MRYQELSRIRQRCEETKYSFNENEILRQLQGNKPLTIMCKVHGTFQIPFAHFVYKNFGCAQCNADKLRESYAKSA